MSGDEFVLICNGTGEIPWEDITAELVGAMQFVNDGVMLSFSDSPLYPETVRLWMS